MKLDHDPAAAVASGLVGRSSVQCRWDHGPLLRGYSRLSRQSLDLSVRRKPMRAAPSPGPVPLAASARPAV